VLIDAEPDFVSTYRVDHLCTYAVRQEAPSTSFARAGRINIGFRILDSVTTVREASAGQPVRGSVRSGRWERLSHGLYVPREPRRLTVDLAAWQLVLPACACFTSLTSAQLRGCWRTSAVRHPVFASVPSHAPHPQRRGLLVTQHPEPIAFEIIDGIHVASAAETLLAAARDLTLLDLVVLGDAAIDFGDCTIDQLSSTASQRRRGAPLLRAAIPLLDKRSESPWE
jgi:hypothetical protein